MDRRQVWVTGGISGDTPAPPDVATVGILFPPASPGAWAHPTASINSQMQQPWEFSFPWLLPASIKCWVQQPWEPSFPGFPPAPPTASLHPGCCNRGNSPSPGFPRHQFTPYVLHPWEPPSTIVTFGYSIPPPPQKYPASWAPLHISNRYIHR